MTTTYFGLGDTVILPGIGVRHHQTFQNSVLESDVSISKPLRFAVDILVCRNGSDRHRFRNPYIIDYILAISLLIVGVEAFAQSSLTPIVQALLVCRCR
jgi:hypothetical protein